MYHVRLRPGDQLLLCTDGLTDMVGENVIAECIDDAADAQAACDDWCRWRSTPAAGTT